MILRPRQRQFVERVGAALKQYKNTLGIAPTGAGKTVMLSASAAQRPGPQLVLQHRDELVEQNERTFRKVAPRVPTDFYTADCKRWSRTGVTFGMVQTLCRDSNLATMPPLTRITVDEGHHAVADSYLKIIHRARELNPDVEIALFTATPGRGDRRTLRTLVDNIADQISLGELIAEGHLVKPRAFVIDVGANEELAELERQRKRFDDFDQAAVERIMNKRAINDKVVEKWREHAGDRQTVVFCSTVQHARDVLDAFLRAGVTARLVHGESATRAQDLEDYDKARYQVVVNVAVLTEGWDHQPTSCVVLLRKESDKGVMMQMVGRGLRTVDPERYPGRTKDDCIILDFGYSLHNHRSLEQHINLASQEGGKQCPECGATVPAAVYDCGICGYEWPKPKTEPRGEGGGEGPNEGALDDFVMTEVELFEQSPFRWEDLFDGLVTIANGLTAWGCVLSYQGRWVALGAGEDAQGNNTGVMFLANADNRLMALAAADDFLREHGDDSNAKKTKSWMHLPPTDKQLKLLGLGAMGGIGLSRYRASCMQTWKFFERGIRQKVVNNVRAAA